MKQRDLVGTWRVVSCTAKLLDTGEIVLPFGENVRGYIQYAQSGHMVVFMRSGPPIKPEGKAPSDVDRIAMHKAVFGGYAATYSIDGNKVTHHIVASWNEWEGTDQVRYFDVQDDELRISTEVMKGMLSGRPVVSELVFRRVG